MEENKLSEPTARRNGRWKLLALLLVCAAPIIASYFAYYIVKPSGRTNYGTLIDQRSHPMPALPSTTLDGRPETLEAYAGKWLMVKVGGGACAQECQAQLFAMRQLRTMQGKNMERIERVWLITDEQPIDTVLIRQYDGMHMLRLPPAGLKALTNWLPVEEGGKREEHIFLVDPRSNLMMRFPKQPEPQRVHKDLSKLLRASAIG